MDGSMGLGDSESWFDSTAWCINSEPGGSWTKGYTKAVAWAPIPEMPEPLGFRGTKPYEPKVMAEPEDTQITPDKPEVLRLTPEQQEKAKLILEELLAQAPDIESIEIESPAVPEVISRPVKLKDINLEFVLGDTAIAKMTSAFREFADKAVMGETFRAPQTGDPENINIALEKLQREAQEQRGRDIANLFNPRHAPRRGKLS
jgi:hypothetical protein